METIKLKFKKIEVDKVDIRNALLIMTFFYEENGKPRQLQKNYSLKEDVDTFVNKLISEIKEDCCKRNAVLIDDDDFLSYHLNILLDENEEGVTKEKIANAIKRFKDKIRSFRNLRESESYIQHYNELIGLKADLC